MRKFHILFVPATPAFRAKAITLKAVTEAVKAEAETLFDLKRDIRHKSVHSFGKELPLPKRPLDIIVIVEDGVVLSAKKPGGSWVDESETSLRDQKTAIHRSKHFVR